MAKKNCEWKMNKIVAGFDLSLTATGYVFLNLDNSIEESGVLLNKYKGMERCYYIRDTILDMCRRKSVRIQHICMEGYSFGSRGMLADLGELGGLIKDVFDNSLGIIYTIVGPNQLKKFATGKGSGKKNVVMMKVYKKYGVEFDDDNECDAFVLAKIAQAMVMRNEIDLDKAQLEVIDKLMSKEMSKEVIKDGKKRKDKIEQTVVFD